MAQQLTHLGFPLFYYVGKKRGEVDFMVEDDSGNVVPIEVKSGRNARAHAAINNLLATEEYALQRGIVFSRLNIERGEKVVYLPWYAVPFLKEFLEQGTQRAGEPFVISLPKV